MGLVKAHTGLKVCIVVRIYSYGHIIMHCISTLCNYALLAMLRQSEDFYYHYNKLKHWWFHTSFLCVY